MISVVVLTFNEAGNLPRCLDSVRFSGDVLVLDSGSTDDTVVVANANGARVLTRPFDSFARQRNFAMEHGELKNEYVLHLDADEVVTPELREELLSIAGSASRWPLAFRIPSRMIFMGRWLRHAGMYPAYQVRYGLRDHLRFIDHGHGQREALPPESIGTVRAPFDHHNFSKGIEHWCQRHRRYAIEEAIQAHIELRSPLEARGLLASDATERRRALKRLANRLPFRPVLRFLYSYVLRFGFMDGYPGYRYARMLATYQGWIDQHLSQLHSESGGSDRG